MPSHKLVVAVDTGNTRAKFGLFRLHNDGVAEPLQITACVLHDTPDLAAAFQTWWKSLNAALPDTAMVAGSHPEHRDSLVSGWPLKNCSPVVVTGYKQIPVGMDVDLPDRVGVDRLLNVFAAGRLLHRSHAVIAVDSGTATTVDLMTSDQVFRGGSILPGLRLSAHAMHDYTARLPLLDFDEASSDVPDLPGRNTVAAMRAGLFYGQLGAVREIVARLSDAAGRSFAESQMPRVFVTGGGGRQLVDHLAGSVYVDSLPLHGLAMLAES